MASVLDRPGSTDDISAEPGLTLETFLDRCEVVDVGIDGKTLLRELLGNPQSPQIPSK